MARFTKNGTDIFEIDDSEDSLVAARTKGYRPLITVTKDGKSTFDLDADDTDSVQAAFKKGYSEVEAYKNLGQSRAESQKNIGKLESFGQGVASAGSFGFDDELSALVAPGKYDDNIETMRSMKANREAANPMTNLAGNLVGGVAVPGLGAAKATSTIGRIGVGAGVGASQGGIQGLGDSEAESLGGYAKDVAQGALLGGTLGAVTGGLIRPKQAVSEVVDAGSRAVDSAKGPLSSMGAAFKQGAREAKEVPILGDLPIVGSAPAQFIGGTKAALAEGMEYRRASKELNELKAQPWPGSSGGNSDESIVSRLLSGGEQNPTTGYVANQASAFGINADDYKKLLDMSPERAKKVIDFDKRAAADDAAPLFQNLQDTFSSVRTQRLGELKKQARAEFKGDPVDVLTSIRKGVFQAEQLKTTQAASGILEDAFEIIRNGKGAEVFGFEPGVISGSNQSTLFDRLQATRQHLDDNIDWTAIKKGTRSPTPVEKTLMRARDEIDKSLKGGSEAKLESDNLFKASKGLEDRFFKIVSDKDGRHEVSLSKIFGDNDKVVKAKTFLKEVEEFAARPDLPDSMRESTSALANNLREAMQTADDKRLYEGFSRATRGPSGPSVERMSNVLGGRDNLATSAITSPASFLDLKAQAGEIAQSMFKTNFSDLNPYQKDALVDYLTWVKSQAVAQKPVTPQLGAAKWDEILTKRGLK